MVEEEGKTACSTAEEEEEIYLLDEIEIEAKSAGETN